MVPDLFFHCESCDPSFLCFQTGAACRHPEMLRHDPPPDEPKTPASCFKAVAGFYADKKAKRSGVPYIEHIKEGLVIMDARGASLRAKNAYCLHPMVQSDECFVNALDERSDEGYWLRKANPSFAELMLALEYRRVANSYLSTCAEPASIDFLTQDIQEMLVADKVQNRKDFELHQAEHPRHAALTSYFTAWMHLLDIDEAEYFELTSLIYKK